MVNYENEKAGGLKKMKYNIYTTVITQYQIEADSEEEARDKFYSTENIFSIFVSAKELNKIQIEPVSFNNRLKHLLY